MKLILTLLNTIYPGLGHAINGKLINGMLIQLTILLCFIAGCQAEILDTTNGLIYIIALLTTVQGASTLFLAKQEAPPIILKKRLLFASILIIFSLSLFGATLSYHEQLIGYRLYYVPSESMQPTLEPGDLILVNCNRVESRVWKKGEVIVFRDKSNRNFFYTKRIAEKPDYLINSDNSLYFVLGDNSNHSNDSRTMGLVDRKTFIGEVKLVLWNIKNHNRWLIEL